MVRYCITEGCKKLTHTHGVCKLCYNRLYAAVKRGDVSLEELMDSGKLLPSGILRSKQKLSKRMFSQKQDV